MTGAFIGWITGMILAIVIALGLVYGLSLSGAVVPLLGFALGSFLSALGLYVGSGFDE